MVATILINLLYILLAVNIVFFLYIIKELSEIHVDSMVIILCVFAVILLSFTIVLLFIFSGGI